MTITRIFREETSHKFLDDIIEAILKRAICGETQALLRLPMSQASKVDDILETPIQLDELNTTKPNDNSYLNIPSEIKRIKCQLEHKKADTWVTCFYGEEADFNQLQLQWATYGDKHRGIAAQWSVESKLGTPIINNFIPTTDLKVSDNEGHYRPEKPIIKCINYEIGGDKHPVWKGQQEYRFEIKIAKSNPKTLDLWLPLPLALGIGVESPNRLCRKVNTIRSLIHCLNNGTPTIKIIEMVPVEGTLRKYEGKLTNPPELNLLKKCDEAFTREDILQLELAGWKPSFSC